MFWYIPVFFFGQGQKLTINGIVMKNVLYADDDHHYAQHNYELANADELDNKEKDVSFFGYVINFEVIVSLAV